MSAMRNAAAAALLLGCWGCGSGELPDYVRLGDLRVLAMTANPPEAAAGAGVTVTPVVSDLNGAGRALTWSAEGCIDPGVGLGASPGCEGRPDRVSLGNGAVTTLAAPDYTGDATPITVNLPDAATIFAGRGPAVQAAGVAYLVHYTQSAGATQVKAFKRVIVSTRAAKNNNPTLNDVTAGGQTLQSYITGLSFDGSAKPEVSLVPELAAGSVESTGSAPETLVTTWFLSDGDIKRFRTLGIDPNGWTPPVQRMARGFLFVLVTRDGRGGESVLKIAF